jgi:hypothetical protein
MDMIVEAFLKANPQHRPGLEELSYMDARDTLKLAEGEVRDLRLAKANANATTVLPWSPPPEGMDVVSAGSPNSASTQAQSSTSDELGNALLVSDHSSTSITTVAMTQNPLGRRSKLTSRMCIVQ